MEFGLILVFVARQCSYEWEYMELMTCEEQSIFN